MKDPIRYKLRIVILFFYLSINTGLLFADSYGYGSIQWKKVDSASGYQVQIKNQKGVRILDLKTESNSLSVENLPPGKYLVRVGLLSPFGDAVVWSGWKPLEIREGSLREFLEKQRKISPAITSKEEKDTGPRGGPAAQIPKEEYPVVPGSGPGKKLGEEKEKSQEEKKMAEAGRNYADISGSIASSEKSTGSAGITGSAVVSLQGRCRGSKIPVEVIKECREDYMILDLSTLAKRSIYNLHILDSQNRHARIQVAKFYQEECKWGDTRIQTRLQELLQSPDPRYNSQEKAEYARALSVIQNCQAK